jgi:phenylacetate-coenzyme A ligase PaaK-like adenylate-forming protein
MSFLHSLRFALFVTRLVHVPQWPPARVERLQRRRLHQLVRFAAKRSPLYREKYRGIDLNHFALSQLPTTNKAEVASHFEESLTDRRIRRADVERFIDNPDNLGRWFLDRYAVSHTSGSQGQPLLILQDRRALKVFFAAMCSRGNPSGTPGVLEGIRRFLHPVRVAIVTMRRGFYPSGSAIELMREIVGDFVHIQRLSSVESDLIERLNEFQPNVLVSYASVLEALAIQSDKLHLHDLRQIANISEQLIPRAGKRIQDVFHVALPDHYATGECLLLSNGCPTQGGSHINADWAILEVVDDNYRPVPPGQLGKKVLVTNLANTVQPFIRYEVGDQVMMAVEPCGCGSRLPRIDHVEGRAAEVFWTFDGTRHQLVSGVLFHTAADSLHEIREWQAIQTERNRVKVRLELLPNASMTPASVRDAFLHALAEHDLPGHVAVDVELVAELLPDQVTSKFRRMISDIGPPDDPQM